MDISSGKLYDADTFAKMRKEYDFDMGRYKMVDHATDAQISRGKVGRNESCPCGSGIKFKKCCLIP